MNNLHNAAFNQQQISTYKKKDNRFLERPSLGLGPPSLN